jgi:hypothetical protein
MDKANGKTKPARFFHSLLQKNIGFQKRLPVIKTGHG